MSKVVLFLSVALFQAGLSAVPAGSTTRQVSPQSPTEGAKRPVTVADAITMTRIADAGYFLGVPTNTHVAHFSPDGKQFVILLKKGDLSQNTNEFTLLLFHSREALHSPTPKVLLKMSSSSNRDAIANAKWLDDSETLAFLCEEPGNLPQVCKFNTRTEHLEKITNHPTEIRYYDISADGRCLLYEAAASRRPADAAGRLPTQGIVIAGQSLLSVLTNPYEAAGDDLFLERVGSRPLRVQPNPNFFAQGPVSLSPNGRYALVEARIREVPSGWSRYKGFVHEMLSTNEPKGTVLPFVQYLLLDVRRQTMSPLLNAPAVGWVPIWSSDSRSVFLKTYVPLDGNGVNQAALLDMNFHPVEVKLPSRTIRLVPEDEWPKEHGSSRLDVTIEQNLETPQRLYVSDGRTNRKSLLLDLNPQFGGLRFGRVEAIEWSVKNGIRLRGGIYFPPDYTPGKRYPLVIQTHGFSRQEEFSMDGLREWSSGFAARPLAAKGIVVLQGVGFATQQDHDHYNDNNAFGSTPEEAGRNLNVLGIEAVIDYLVEHGIADKNRIGIVGFSRTVCFVGYLLTHSNRHFAAANLVDGTDCGYFEEMAFPAIAWDLDNINGGAPPFGNGLQRWFRESPGFNLEKVSTPVRLLALGPGSALGMWDWYAGLALQGKPVEFIMLPEAAHLVVKPWERLVAQEEMVDWFCFWLKGEEDRNPANAARYERWRQLRNELASPASAVN